MNETLDIKTDSEMLWLSLKLKKQLYAIDSSTVESIFQLDQTITPLPESTATKPGIINLRGKIISLVDLRLVLGMESLVQEQKEFEAMLEQRKIDHQNWVKELERCLDEDDKFHLATDPHKCAFGKWYDNYHTDVQTVAFHLNKIDEPHKKLHHTAHLAFECPRHCEECERDQCLRDKLREDAKSYMQIVVGLLDEAKQVFRDSYRKMCIVITDANGDSTGLLVDEVIAVETLNLQPLPAGNGLAGTKAEQLVSYTAQKSENDHQILVLNNEALFRL